MKGLLGNATTKFINLQYAYDTLIFGNYDIRQAIMLKGIMRCFEVWSGLRISYSFIVFWIT